MDPNTEKPAENPHPPAQPTAMDVVAPPPAEKAEVQQDSPQAEQAPTDKQPHEEIHEKPPKPPKKSGGGVGLAITATVIIIFGLAALATFAYLQSQ